MSEEKPWEPNMLTIRRDDILDCKHPKTHDEFRCKGFDIYICDYCGAVKLLRCPACLKEMSDHLHPAIPAVKTQRAIRGLIRLGLAPIVSACYHCSMEADLEWEYEDECDDAYDDGVCCDDEEYY